MSIKCADVQAQYNKIKELKKEDIVLLQEWLKLQPHLPPISELQLIIFLHSCYYRNEAAKKVIDNFYSVRTAFPEMFKNRNPNSPEIAIQKNVFAAGALPKLTPEGYRIYYLSLLDRNPEMFNFTLELKIFDMLLMQDLLEHGCQNGQVYVMDLAGGTFSHFARVPMMDLKRLIFYIQEASPIRMKAIHIINPAPFTDKLLGILKLFSNAELLKLIHVHHGKTIFDHIPAECLPNDCGGTVGSIAELHAKQLNILAENAEAFVADEKLFVDESKRPGKPKNYGDLFGVEGTFKKLEID